MGSQIQINRLGERFSSHTQTPRPRRHASFGDDPALREKLTAAAVEVLTGGREPLAGASDPRLGQSRALA
jgi:hypothetical protein